MKGTKKEIVFSLLRVLPLLLCIVLFIVYLLSDREITAEMIINYAPTNLWLAAIFLWLLYAVKSLSIVFPLIILNIAGGFLFPPVIAVFVNMVGILIELMIPYGVGRISRRESAGKLIKKYPKLEEIISQQKGSALFLSFFLRIISCLPGDAVSMYLGATQMPFFKYLLGSFLGTVPGIISATLIGSSITDPTSPMFWISVVLTVVISAASFLVYFFWRRKKKRQEGGADA